MNDSKKRFTQEKVSWQRQVVEVRIEALVVLCVEPPPLVVHQVAVDDVIAQVVAYGQVGQGSDVIDRIWKKCVLGWATVITLKRNIWII